ncbi:MAG TPA: endonuclease/exonuclease/phosphatase family protein [Blastocatellia bacterium]|nr:endonuclease/exonuclease/phosphatase family protein [Blastocatellia bacterium]
MLNRVLRKLTRELVLKLFRISCVAALFFSVLGYFGTFHRYGELSSHFRVQYLIIAIGSSVGFACFRAWRWLIASVVCVLLNGAVVVPGHLLPMSVMSGRGAGPKAHNFRVLLSNVLYRNRNYRLVTDLVRTENPDVVILQEATSEWLEALKELSTSYPYSRREPENVGTIACFSRYPLEDVDATITDRAKPWMIITKVNIGGKAVSLISIHPPPPVSRTGLPNRNEQFAVTAAIARLLPAPMMVVGDLNTSPWSPYFSRFISESGLVSTRKGFGVLPTWPTYLPPMMIPIDHCLVSPDIKVVNCRTGSDVGSDHLPLVVDLLIPGAEGNQ